MGEIALAAQISYSYVICTKIMFIKPDPGKKNATKKDVVLLKIER